MENDNLVENAIKIALLIKNATKELGRADIRLKYANELPYSLMPFRLISKAKKHLEESLKNLEEAQELIEKDTRLDSVSIKNKLNIEKIKKRIERLNITFEKLKTALGV